MKLSSYGTRPSRRISHFSSAVSGQPTGVSVTATDQTVERMCGHSHTRPRSARKPPTVAYTR